MEEFCYSSLKFLVIVWIIFMGYWGIKFWYMVEAGVLVKLVKFWVLFCVCMKAVVLLMRLCWRWWWWYMLAWKISVLLFNCKFLVVWLLGWVGWMLILFFWKNGGVVLWIMVMWGMWLVCSWSNYRFYWV